MHSELQQVDWFPLVAFLQSIDRQHVVPFTINDRTFSIVAFLCVSNGYEF